jgi:hypothetical protein
VLLGVQLPYDRFQAPDHAVFAATGAGNRVHFGVGHKSTRTCALIRRMSIENPLWSAPRIHGELLKLGFEVAQSSVAKYMVKRHGPPSQGWRTFLRNHASDIAAMDLFVAPTIGFDLLYGLVIIRLARRKLVWINVTPNPTAEWIVCQITEAFPWDEAPHNLIRDQDRVYGAIVTCRHGHPNALRGKTKIFYGPPPHASISFPRVLQMAQPCVEPAFFYLDSLWVKSQS